MKAILKLLILMVVVIPSAQAYSLVIPPLTYDLNHSELNQLNWSESGHVLDTNLFPIIEDWYIESIHQGVYLALSDYDTYGSISMYVLTGVAPSFTIDSNGISIIDPNKPDGYACWVSGLLISQVNPCGT